MEFVALSFMGLSLAAGIILGAAINADRPSMQTKERVICQDYLGGILKDDVCIKDGKVISTKRQK